MTPSDADLTRESFESVIARAVELDDQGTERVDPERARTIATELGITSAIWDRALAEHASAHRTLEMSRRRTSFLTNRFGIAVAGFAAGSVAGLLHRGDIATGILILSGAAAIVREGA